MQEKAADGPLQPGGIARAVRTQKLYFLTVVPARLSEIDLGKPERRGILIDSCESACLLPTTDADNLCKRQFLIDPQLRSVVPINTYVVLRVLRVVPTNIGRAAATTATGSSIALDLVKAHAHL